VILSATTAGESPTSCSAFWLLALTLGILLNTLTGRPARALAAYDGR
jgi:hypothetical protein